MGRIYDYDIHGPRVRHDPAPAEPLTRQQRRKLERRGAKAQAQRITGSRNNWRQFLPPSGGEAVSGSKTSSPGRE